MNTKLRFCAWMAFYLVLQSTPVKAQVFDLSGQNPTALKWHELNSDHFRVIYQGDAYQIAQKAMNCLESAYIPVSKSIGVLPRPTSIVIQSQNADNNGFVSTGPRRAEFLINPPQNPYALGLNDWMEELSFHEYRHIVQLEKTKMGWGKAMYMLFGNTGLALTEGITNPWWFWEGDAVGVETVFGYGGRGRIPSFDLPLRTRFLSNKPLPYDRAVCGSLKELTPNHYLLGYYLTTHVKNKFGSDSWNKVLSYVYTHPPYPFAFSHGLKKVTGLTVKQLYKETRLELTTLWNDQLSHVSVTPATYFLHKKNKVFTNYKYPYQLKDGRVIAMKSGLADGGFNGLKSSVQDMGKLVILGPGGKEKTLCQTGVLDDIGKISCRKNIVAWSEYTYDPRWGARNYTVIKTFNLVTRKCHQLTHKTKLHAPDISPDGKTIVAVDFSTSSNCHLVLLDAQTGKIIQVFDNQNNNFYLQPSFSEDGKYIVAIQTIHGGKSIIKLDIASGHITTILPWVAQNIAVPIQHNHYVFFNSPQTGIDNIHVLDLIDGKEYQVTSRKLGAFNASFSPIDNTMFFHDYTASGTEPAFMVVDSSQWVPVSEYPDTLRSSYFDPYLKAEGGNIMGGIPDSTYLSKPYIPRQNLFKIYGWGYQLPFEDIPGLRFGLNAQDLISTFQFDAGISYDRNEHHFGKYASIKYYGFYPVLSLNYDDSKHQFFNSLVGNDGPLPGGLHDYHYQVTKISISLPLNFSKGAYTRKTELNIEGRFTEISTVDFLSKGYKKAPKVNFFNIGYTFKYAQELRQSKRDIAPRFGFGVQMSVLQTPFPSKIEGGQFAINGQVFLPGIGKHHSIRLRALYLQNQATGFYFNNPFLFVRGYPNELDHKLSIATVEYKFPLAYPDLSLGGVLYIQQAKTNLFTDIGWGKAPLESGDFQAHRYLSYGIEQTFDVNLLRFLVPLNMGLRLAYDPYHKRLSDEFILTVSRNF